MLALSPAFFFVSALLTGCGSTTLSAEDLDSGEQALEALNAVQDDEMLWAMTTAALASMPMGRSSSCTDGLQAAMKARPDSQQTRFAMAMQTCGHTCPSDLQQIAIAEASQKMPLVIADCDGQGPDPLFSGPLAESRKDFDVMEYLILRLQVDHLVKAAKNEGSDRSAALVKGLQDLAPRLATGMKARKAASDAALEGSAL